ncbi:unnamed protein product [Prorocentrum cordatum]|uniref:Uncharacterized protein n=1 Tax=Prorocentrum cordatum TaxID=2364126 RepID=A0ABN9T6D9_9DINO|nr:unnamed protein product [Polarella glacialis]
MAYAQVSVGDNHTALLRSDGTAVACGHNGYGECDLPEAGGGTAYGLPTLVLQASFDGVSVNFKTLCGEELCQIKVMATDGIAKNALKFDLAGMLGPKYLNVDVVSPEGKLLGNQLAETIEGFFGVAARHWM